MKKPMLIAALAYICLCCYWRAVIPPRLDYSKTVVEAKNKLLRLHPDWCPIAYGAMEPHTPLEWDHAFIQRGYLSLQPDTPRPIENETLHLLGDCSPEMINKSKLPELREENWRGLVYVRVGCSRRPVVRPEVPGWHGRCLVRAGCLFFGDKEMLEQIDRDLR